ncbi:MAG: LPS assembly lipoprotein LptE [Deltaproteobacteria bacterium]|nr:LPS assembly lipoprotein LptE [Deltaproteobacteria bacterium]
MITLLSTILPRVWPHAWPRAKQNLFAKRTFRLQAAALALGLAALGGCGYSLETVRLPAQAATLGLGSVTNHTFQGELDLRMNRALQRRVMAIGSADLVSPNDSDLVLEVDLTRFDVSRFRDISQNNAYTFQFTLSGTMTLRDRRNGRVLLDHQPVEGTARLDFTVLTMETPALRDQGIELAVNRLADIIVQRMYNTY